VTVTLVGLCLLSSLSIVPPAHALGQNDAIIAALNWLTAHQQADGSYGGFTEPQTAPAANALWVRFQDSPAVLLSYRWLKNQLQNSTTWFWSGVGSLNESDIPGEILYSFDQSRNLQLLNQLPQVEAHLSKFQDQTSGGFQGYYQSGRQVTSSVDTAMSLLGLIGANGISVSNKTAATSYLLTLQNPNGSFNLTSSLAFDSIYSLGPEPFSITALVLLALQAASFTATNPHVLSALNYLANAAHSSFNGHVYAAALSLLIFTDFSDPEDASSADNFILNQQNSDGGFRDMARSSTGSNALDTGWAALALQLGGSVCCASSGNGGGGAGRIMYL
jgi:A-macroglobulin complement component/prenyltransferase/squalene oxidase-like repeat protein